MTPPFAESTVEDAALGWLEAIGWQIAHGPAPQSNASRQAGGPDLAPDVLAAERRDYGEVVLAQRLRDALARLSPDLPAEALEDAFRKLTRPDLPAGQAGGAELIQRNRALHRLPVDGVMVEYREAANDAGASARSRNRGAYTAREA